MANNITIDGKEYPLEALSDIAKGNLFSMQLVDRKIAEAQQELAILQTARTAYAKALKEALPGEELSL